jgi:hypothetical protein
LNEAKPVVAMEWEFGDVICGYRIDGFRDMEVILVIKSWDCVGGSLKLVKRLESWWILMVGLRLNLKKSWVRFVQIFLSFLELQTSLASDFSNFRLL